MTRTMLRAPHRGASRHPRRKSLLLALALGLGLLIFGAACSEETQDQIRDSAEQGGGEEGGGEEPAPAPEPPPETAPPETAPAPAPAPEGDDEFSDADWVLINALGVIALLVSFGATSMATHRSEKKNAAMTALDRRVRDIGGGGRWLHDQGSMDVLRTTNADEIRITWAGVRGSTIDLEGQIAALRSGIDDVGLDNALAELGVRVAGLRGSLESYVSLRTDPVAPSAALVENATQNVLDRRRQLDAAQQFVTVPR
jgi:hypothetical protein